MLPLVYLILLLPFGTGSKLDLNFKINIPLEKEFLTDFLKSLQQAYHKFNLFLAALSLKTTAMAIRTVNEFKMMTYAVFYLVKGRRIDSMQQFFQTVRDVGKALGKSSVAAVRAVSELTIRNEMLLARVVTNVLHTLQDVHIAMIHILPKLDIEEMILRVIK